MVSPVVWAETSAAFDYEADFLDAMEKLGIQLAALSEKSLWHAGRIWRKYRATDGNKQRILTDFLIGSHALHQCDRLLTRDRGFYRAYFKGLVIVDPMKP